MSKNNVPESGNTWQEGADPNFIKDETGGWGEKKVGDQKPAKSEKGGQNAPGSNWPY